MKNSEGVKVITNKNIMTPKNIMTNIICKNNKIASGRSILINKNNLSKLSTISPSQSKINSEITSKDECKSSDLDSIMNTSIANLRPDTPLSLSLSDDVGDIKTNIDLTPCPSSNRMKFSDPNSLKIINALAEQLEEISTSSNLNECAPLISNFRNTKSTPSDLIEILQDITFLSDYEDACDDSSIIDIDDEDQLDSDYKGDSNQKAFSSNIKSQAITSRPINHHEFISDHSYTRPKGFSGLGVETPSDSG